MCEERTAQHTTYNGGIFRFLVANTVSTSQELKRSEEKRLSDEQRLRLEASARKSNARKNAIPRPSPRKEPMDDAFSSFAPGVKG